MKKTSLILTILMAFTISISVSAKTNQKGYIIKNDTLITNKANVTISGCLNRVNGSYNPNYAAPYHLHCLDSAEQVTILNYDSIIKSTISDCKQGYYKVEHTKTSDGKTYSGYVCADYVKTSIDANQYADELNKFPGSYREKLSLLKQIHPNWIFTPFQTNIDWNNAITQESVVGMSYIQFSNPNPLYLSLDEGSYDPKTGKYIQQEAGGFYAANKATVAYYMDPRNFLDEMNLFQFENLGYNPTYQTKAVVDSILASTPLSKYSNSFIQAATYDGNSVSPISLAARSRQEVVQGSRLTASADGSKGYYNFYNLGAWSSCENPIECAINFASGYGGSYTSYNRPWKSADAAIKGGAKYIADGYINKKQNTLYFQKWDVVGYNGNFNHQYMTNIKAAVSEGKTTWNSYKSIGLLNQPIEFIIPVYLNMSSNSSALPTTVSKPPSTNTGSNTNPPSNSSIPNIISSLGYQNSGEYITNIKIGTTASKMIQNFKGKGASITIKTTNSSGTKTISSSEKLGTGDTIIIQNGSNPSTYRIVVTGDTNGDGNVNAVDYVKLYKYILSSSSLSGSYKMAADINKDGKVTAIDYVKLYKYIVYGGKLS